MGKMNNLSLELEELRKSTNKLSEILSTVSDIITSINDIVGSIESAFSSSPEKPKENKKDNSYEEIEKEDKLKEEETEKFVCPECGNESIIPTGGCGICLQCGYSKCN